MVNEVTSDEVQAIAAKGLRWPEKLTPDEIKAVCASALTQGAPGNDIVDPEIPAGPGFLITP